VLDENGYLDPIIKDIDISFGKSYLYHDNKIVAFVMHQFIYFGIIIVENSAYFAGNILFSRFLGPMMDEALNHYSTSFFLDSPLNGQDTWAVFDFDWKSTQSPSIGNGYIDLFILGEMFYQPYDFGLLEPGDHGWESKACQLDPEVMDFMSSETFSQLVITESAFSCMVNAIS